MRSLRLALPLVLASSFVFGPACHKGNTASGEHPRTGRKTKKKTPKVQLPDPLPLPAEPKAAAYLAQPQGAVDLLSPYSPYPLQIRGLIQLALGRVTTPTLAEQLATAVDPEGTFSNVVLEGREEVIRLSIAPESAKDLAAELAKLEAVGEFGAVRLPSADGGGGSEGKPARAREWLAWIDAEDGGALVIANSLPGLVTGRELKKAYGQRDVFFTANLASLPLPAEIAGEIPFAHVEGRGDLSKVELILEAKEGVDPLAGIPIAPDTLGGLLDGPDITAGASTTYADYDSAVREVIVEVNSQVKALPFLVRGIGENLAAKLNTVLRSWDGRVLVALGPSGHLRVAYGAKDVDNSRVAMIRLIQAVVENVEVGRKFMSQLPRLSFRRRVAKGDGNDVELFVIHEATNKVPPELRGLVDGKGRLNVAMSWSERAGGGMFVVGPQAEVELARWLDETKGSASGKDTRELLASATFAGDAEALKTLVSSAEPDLGAILQMAASGPKWSVSAREQSPGVYAVELRTPAKPARAK